MSSGKRNETSSSQPHAGDPDPPDRGSKKSKIAWTASAGSAESAMEVEEDSTAIGDACSQPLDVVEVVPETPVEDQGDMHHAITDWPAEGAIPEAPYAEQAAVPNVASPTEPVKARSYLDMVEICPSCPKPTDHEVSNMEDPIIGNDRHNDPQEVAAENAKIARVPTKGKPYGPWMIATRRERRQEGRPSGNGRHAEASAHKAQSTHAQTAAGRTGSRFAALGEDAEPGEHDGVAKSPDHLGGNHEATAVAGPLRSEKQPAGLGGKPRRANVIVNEKQIQNEPRMSQSANATEKAPTQGRRQTGSCSRRAAEEDEHVVIRGAQGGKVISSTTVQNGEKAMATAPAASHPPTEHHGDPPEDLDDEGDVIMDITTPQKGLAEGGGASGPST
nr:uncharacterized protein LOC109158503 [Ipomoea trifida]